MTDIIPKSEQCSAMEAIYNHQDVFVWLPTGYGKTLCYQVLPFIMDYKQGVVEMQTHSLVLVVSPLVARSIALVCKRHKIYLAHLYASFLSLRNNFHFNYAHVQTVCTRPSPPPILEGLGTRLHFIGTSLKLPSIKKRKLQNLSESTLREFSNSLFMLAGCLLGKECWASIKSDLHYQNGRVTLTQVGISHHYQTM